MTWIDHDHSLIAVLEGFEHHVKVNVNKMKFLICKATFMSHVTTTDGLQPNPITLKAMITMPTPTEKQEVRLGAALLQTIKPHSSSALDESSLRPIAYCKRPNHYRRVLYLAIVEALNTFEELLLGKSNSLYRPSTLSVNLQEGPRLST